MRTLQSFGRQGKVWRFGHGQLERYAEFPHGVQEFPCMFCELSAVYVSENVI